MTPKSGRSILRRQALGFATIIVCCWIAEFFHLPHLFFGETDSFSVKRALARSGCIALVWIWTYLMTRALVRRLHELEEFLRVCSWCRKIGTDQGWLTMEQFFGSHLATETSHGICPDCAQKQFPNRLAAERVVRTPQP